VRWSVLLRVRDNQISNPVSQTGEPNYSIFVALLASFSDGNSNYAMLPSTALIFHYSLVVLSFEAI
jgi:hypothetical protein